MGTLSYAAVMATEGVPDRAEAWPMMSSATAMARVTRRSAARLRVTRVIRVTSRGLGSRGGDRAGR